VDDVPATAAMLRDAAALGAYRSSSDELTAMGDEFGMLIVAKRDRGLDHTPVVTPGASVHRTAVAIRGPKAARHRLASYPYEIGVEERCSCA
jgi:hypothetical protein